MASKRRSGNSTSRTNVLAIIGILLAVALIVAGLWWDKQRTAVAVKGNPNGSSQAAFTNWEKDEPSAAPLRPALDKLARDGEPAIILVIGDSTGNNASEWVYLLGDRLVAQTGRPVTIRPWSDEDTAYGQDVSTPGSGAPITILNYSAPGRGPDYALENFNKAATGRPDLAIINHGHNTSGPDLDNALGRIALRLTTQWDQPPAIMATIQNPRTDNTVQSEAAIRAARNFGDRRPDVTMIDVAAAFEKQGTEALLGDGVHPNAAGQQVWTETVAQALGIE